MKTDSEGVDLQRVRRHDWPAPGNLSREDEIERDSMILPSYFEFYL